MDQELIVPFDAFDTNQVIADREAIEQYIPQRFEMAQLDGVYFEDPDDYRAVGFKKIKLAFGEYVQVFDDPEPTKMQAARTIRAIVMGAAKS